MTMPPGSPRTSPALPQQTGSLDAADRVGLDAAQLDAVAATMLNLVAEVASLAGRVSELEARESGAPASHAEAVQDLVRRVLAPLAGDSAEGQT
jgi:hypothetical protein